MFRAIDRDRWLAVAQARKLVEDFGGTTNGISDEDALCRYIVWAEEHAEHPAARWYQSKPTKTQRAAWKRDWEALA